jgi:hypothetical protein
MFADFSRIHEATEIVENWQMLENAETENIDELRAANELNEMADLVEVKDLECEFDELIENLRDTADLNPLSETAFDLKVKAMKVLQELR